MKRLGLFHVGCFAYAVPLEQVEKILQGAKLFKLPRLPRAVAEVLVDAGQMIPLFDFVKMFGDLALPAQNEPICQVLVSTEYGVVALPANVAGQIVATSKGREFQSADNVIGGVGNFIYLNEEYNILDINYLALEMAQGLWQD